MGTLILVSTPIGNLGDMTARAIETLEERVRILAEDTRHTRKLLAHFDIHNELVSYHDHNKERVTPGFIDRLLGGESLAVVTDAGTPGISDPGFYILRAAIAAGIPVERRSGGERDPPGPSSLGISDGRVRVRRVSPEESGRARSQVPLARRRAANLRRLRIAAQAR